MNTISQSSYLTISTPLDEAVKRNRKFKLLKLTGEEKLCGDFAYTLEIICPERLSESEFDELIGQAVTVHIGYNIDNTLSERLINGMVFKVKERGMNRFPHGEDVWNYSLEISSWLSQLKAAKECRIFQKNSNTHLSIVTDLLLELGFNDFRNETKRKFPRKGYETIYNESYYDFIIRLLQEEGIIWRFEHKKNKHVLVLSDGTSNLPEIDAASWSGLDRFESFGRLESYNPLEEVQLSDFDYDNPPEKTVGKKGNGVYNYFEYPGYFSSREEGEDTQSRLKNLLKSEDLIFHGTSTIRKLEAGKRFRLKADTLPEYHNSLFTITQLKIEASADRYTNSFTVIPAKNTFIYPPEEKKSKPYIIGNQTALVVGDENAAGSHIDNQGRILVRFHWDRHSPTNTGSAFIRNAMPAAGPRRGFIFNPKVGSEVVVCFENGDPNRPMVVGRVFAATQSLPESPAQHPERSVIQAGSAGDTNRILFEDKEGSEKLEFQAKKDMEIKVGGDLKIKVEDDLTILADNLTITADGNILTGNIVTLTGGSIVSNAGKDISNLTGLVVANVFGGLMNNKAGANGINIALGMVDSNSGAHTLQAAPMIFNTTAGSIDINGKGGVTNIGLIVANTALEIIENSAKDKVGQKASLAIITNAKNQTNTFEKETTTQALMVKNKCEMVVNDE